MTFSSWMVIHKKRSKRRVWMSFSTMGWGMSESSSRSGLLGLVPYVGGPNTAVEMGQRNGLVFGEFWIPVVKK
jgi:hypothetical protein